MPGYPHEASYFEYRLCHKIFSGLNLKINCTDNICDRVSTQSKKLKDAILVAFDCENVEWKMVYNFLGIDEKT